TSEDQLLVATGERRDAVASLVVRSTQTGISARYSPTSQRPCACCAPGRRAHQLAEPMLPRAAVTCGPPRHCLQLRLSNVHPARGSPSTRPETATSDFLRRSPPPLAAAPARYPTQPIPGLSTRRNGRSERASRSR